MVIQQVANDKRHAILLAVKAWRDRPAGEIADQIGCSRSWVSEVRAEQDSATGNLSRVTGKDGKSYPATRCPRETHGTFEDYCRERWGMERRHAYRLIDAAGVVSNLCPTGHILPTTERQARELTALEPEQQREVWTRAVETAPNRPLFFCWTL